VQDDCILGRMHFMTDSAIGQFCETTCNKIPFAHHITSQVSQLEPMRVDCPTSANLNLQKLFEALKCIMGANEYSQDDLLHRMTRSIGSKLVIDAPLLCEARLTKTDKSKACSP
jgi:hypothetical protein